MTDEQFIKYAATTVKADGQYAYDLADLLTVLQEHHEVNGTVMPLAEIHRVSLEWGKARHAHQQSISTGRNGR